jgi:hypothetical protein
MSPMLHGLVRMERNVKPKNYGQQRVDIRVNQLFLCRMLTLEIESSNLTSHSPQLMAYLYHHA